MPRMVLAVSIGLLTIGSALADVGTGFTYQGQIKQGGSPYNGNADLTFELYDQPAGGTLLGSQSVAAVPVSGGLFTVTLNAGGEFGPNAFTGDPRWLQISVNGNVLAPRQPVTSAPYSIRSRAASSLSAPDGSPAAAVFVDDDGRVGIGTTTPTTPLSLRATGDVLMSLRSTDSDRDAWSLRLPSRGELQMLGRDPAAQFTFGARGALGIGVLDPTAPLTIRAADDVLSLRDSSNRESWLVSLSNGDLLFRDLATGSDRLRIGTSNPTALQVKGTTTTNVLRITGGADIAEPFNVHDATPRPADEPSRVQPGMVVSIDPVRAGELRVADRAYDSRVAGVISGAGGVEAGLTLQQIGTSADGKHPVALTGRVWTWCDADAGGAIQPGDLLTTSDTPGHAMKVGDRGRAGGAILGKAMSSLESGRGLVLVLINLQ